MTLAEQTLSIARKHGLKITTAESCTGGMIISSLTDIAGSSDVVDRGFITYSNSAKQGMLGVSRGTLKGYGAVSEQVATQMAQGALQKSDSQIAIAVTGVAGPGASDNKSEGLVWFALATPTKTHAEKVNFGALGRAGVRTATVDHALQMILDHLAV